jgi:hypothetical protein
MTTGERHDGLLMELGGRRRTAAPRELRYGVAVSAISALPESEPSPSPFGP